MRAIGYVRVSTSKQDLKRQMELIQTHCEKNGLELVRVIEDNGISGKSNDREGYKQLMQLSSEDCNTVIASEISRVSRQSDVLETANDLKKLHSRGISITFLDSKVETIAANEEFDINTIIVLVISLWGAAQERKKIGGRMSSGAETKARSAANYFLNGRVPLGYRLEDHKLVINEEEAKIVKTVFDMVLTGSTQNECCKYLYVLLGGKYNTPSAVSKILTNRIYIGEYNRIVNGKTIMGSVEPIIDAATFDKVQEMKTANKLKHSKAKTSLYKNELRGVVKCECGGVMYISTNCGVPYYRCSTTRKLLHSEEKHTMISANTLEEVLDAVFEKSLRSYVEENKKKRMEEIRDKVTLREAELAKVRIELEAAEAKLEKAAYKLAEAELEGIDEVRIKGNTLLCNNAKRDRDAKKKRVEEISGEVAAFKGLLEGKEEDAVDKWDYYRKHIETITVIDLGGRVKKLKIALKYFGDVRLRSIAGVDKEIYLTTFSKGVNKAVMFKDLQGVDSEEDGYFIRYEQTGEDSYIRHTVSIKEAIKQPSLMCGALEVVL